MDIGSLLLIIALTLIVAGFVARPLLDRAAARDTVAGTSDLTTQREAVLTELRELDFDHDTGKIAEDDYLVQRTRLVETGARILRALDQLQAAHAGEDAVERLVAARRAKPAASDDAVEARIAARRAKPAKAASGPACPKCGNAVQASDKFCPHCGQKLN